MKKMIYLMTLLVLATSCEEEKKEPENLNKQFSSTKSYGCSSFIVYKLNEEKSMAIAVLGNRTNLELSMTEQTFDLSQMDPEVLRVEIVKTKDPYYCDDVAGDEILDEWIGTKGKVSIRITKDYESDLPQPCLDTYQIEVRIENVYLENNKGDKVYIDYLEFENVTVGWCPG